jgi:hypothetical protein
MLLYFDIDLESFVSSPGSRSALTQIEFMRDALAQVEIAVCQDAAVIELDETQVEAVELAFKVVGDFDSDPRARAMGWTKTGAGESTRYQLGWSFITEPLNDDFGVGAGVDVSFVDLYVELYFRYDGRSVRSRRCTARVNNNVVRDEDGTPEQVPGAEAEYFKFTIAQTLTNEQKAQKRQDLGLGSAATADAGGFATAEQGELADSALQSIDNGLVNTAIGENAAASRDALQLGDFSPVVHASLYLGGSGAPLFSVPELTLAWDDGAVHLQPPATLSGDFFPRLPASNDTLSTVGVSVALAIALGS